MSAHPFIRDIAHVFDGAIADPGHEFTVKLELWPALGKQEAPDVLGVPVVGVNDRVPGDGTAMPIEIHAAILPDILRLGRERLAGELARELRPWKDINAQLSSASSDSRFRIYYAKTMMLRL